MNKSKKIKKENPQGKRFFITYLGDISLFEEMMEVLAEQYPDKVKGYATIIHDKDAFNEKDLKNSNTKYYLEHQYHEVDDCQKPQDELKKGNVYKRKHGHAVLTFEKVIRANQIINCSFAVEGLEITYCRTLSSINESDYDMIAKENSNKKRYQAALQYLTHMNNEALEKFQYDDNDVICKSWEYGSFVESQWWLNDRGLEKITRKVKHRNKEEILIYISDNYPEINRWNYDEYLDAVEYAMNTNESEIEKLFNKLEKEEGRKITENHKIVRLNIYVQPLDELCGLSNGHGAGVGKSTFSEWLILNFLKNKGYPNHFVYLNSDKNKFDNYHNERAVLFDDISFKNFDRDEFTSMFGINPTSNMSARYHNKIPLWELCVVNAISKFEDNFATLKNIDETEDRWQFQRRFELIFKMGIRDGIHVIEQWELDESKRSHKLVDTFIKEEGGMIDYYNWLDERKKDGRKQLLENKNALFKACHS